MEIKPKKKKNAPIWVEKIFLKNVCSNCFSYVYLQISKIPLKVLRVLRKLQFPSRIICIDGTVYLKWFDKFKRKTFWDKKIWKNTTKWLSFIKNLEILLTMTFFVLRPNHYFPKSKSQKIKFFEYSNFYK